MLIGHVVAQHAPPDLGQALLRAGARLESSLPGVPWCVELIESHRISSRRGRRSVGDFRQATSPTLLRRIGTKPGSASTRPSQARTDG